MGTLCLGCAGHRLLQRPRNEALHPVEEQASPGTLETLGNAFLEAVFGILGIPTTALLEFLGPLSTPFSESIVPQATPFLEFLSFAKVNNFHFIYNFRFQIFVGNGGEIKYSEYSC